MTLEKFDILEEKVSQLAEKYSQLKLEKDNSLFDQQKKEKEISALRDKVKSLEEEKGEISVLQEKVQSLEEEKNAIKSRLEKIISNLEVMAGNF